ncbi:hypothetical protein ADP71_28990 [Vitreoscilla sp. C1]|uniref:ATP-dependent nuclease n=1 Tax=Vitreoscilla sp. (strain C1) TaxID=96942 RepID=UPI000CDC9B11|nr:AAA family ATPase [Vitreoscilla sp. C1]AUZ06124.1 hypothetical protein ADP71_28990 [Vitreoscilla sp. C1]
MSLKLSEIIITNFKSCRDITLSLSNFTPLIGYNNAGKSNCLTAIQWLLRRFVLQHKDFNDENQPIEIFGTIEGIEEKHLCVLEEKHRKSIEKYLQGHVLKIKRVQQKPSCKLAEIKFFVWDWANSKWVPNPGGIDNAIDDLFPEPIRVGAMENAAEDASKAKTSTTLGKLLELLTKNFQQQHAQQISTHLDSVNDYLSANGTNRLAALTQIDNDVNTNIQDFFPDIGIKLHFESPSFQELFKSGTIKVVENGLNERDVTSYGHGAQRSIQMGLIRYLAASSQTIDETKKTLLLIDEPELYLHPFAIEQLREALLKLSNGAYQVIISTHSAQMVTESLAQDALLIYKNQTKGTCVRNRLSDAVKKVVQDYKSQAALLFSLTNSSQILFSEQVLLTEGKTEKRLLPEIFYQYFGKTLAQKNYSLVAKGGVDNTAKTIAVLQDMGIPFKAICDLDYVFKGAIEHKIISLADVALKDCIDAIKSKQDTYNIVVDNSKGAVTFKDIGSSKRERYQIIEELACDEEIKPHIQNLHEYFKQKNIWIWTQGAIEKPLNLIGKKEEVWAEFNHKLKNEGLEQSCADYQEIKKLMEWIVPVVPLKNLQENNNGQVNNQNLSDVFENEVLSE